MTQQNCPQTPPLEPGYAYGGVPDMKEMAILGTIEALKARFKRQKKKHLRSDAEYRALAEKQHARSIAGSGNTFLGTGTLPADVIAEQQAATETP